MQLHRPIPVLLALLLAACSAPIDLPGETPDAAVEEPCANPCGELCCAEGEQCDPATSTCAPPCEPRCAGRVCGSDSCGGSCGECPESHACDENAGRCVCVPDCRGKLCGDDGCGGTCGTCGPAQACSDGACLSCVPACDGRSCGFDGCGGLCGSCAPGQVCEEENGACVPCSGDASCAGNSAGERCSAGRCVECSEDGHCAIGRCDLPSGRCVECGSDGHCAQVPGKPYCEAQRCTQCRTDADCGGATPECGPGGSCRVRGGNDSCAAPERLNFSGTVARASGTTVGAKDDGRGGCGGGGADRVYRVELTGETYLDVTVVPRDPSFQPVLYVLEEDCAYYYQSDELGCGAAATPGATTRIELSAVPAGTYWIWVDGAAGSAGAYDLEVRKRTPPPPPANDGCAGVIPLDFVNGRAHVQGDSRSAAPDVEGSCQSVGRDVVYRITTTAEHRLAAQVFRDFSTPAFEPALHLRNDCASGASTSEHACHAGSSGLSRLELARLAPGTYYLWVDARSASGGRFTLDVELLPPGPAPLNERCASAATLAFDSTGKATARGALAPAEDDDDGTCGGSWGDVVYRFTTVAERRLTATVSNVPANVRPYLYVRGECGAYDRQLACDPQEVEVNVLAPGTWYLWVDSGSSAAGEFDVTVQLDAPRYPPAHDVCAGAIPIPMANGVGRVSGSTRLATGSTAATCGGNAEDVVYTFTTTVEQDVVATVSPTAGSPDYEPVVFIRNACASSSPSAQFGCGALSSGKATAQAAKLPPGTWYVWVDGEDSKGDFELEVKLSEPPLTGNVDFCPGVSVELVDDRAVLTGSTTGFVNNTGSWTCGGGGPDHVYAITLPTRSSLTVRVDSPGTVLAPVVYLRGDCTSELLADELSCGNGDPGMAYPAWFRVDDLAPGTYYLWIDGYDGSDGVYSAEIVRGPVVTAPPAGNRCPGPALTLVNGTVTVEENTALADDWVDSSCNVRGLDTAFSFTLPVEQSVTAKVTPIDPALMPVVSIRSTCSDYTSESVCRYTSTFGGTAEAVAPRLPAGTYTVWVDSVTDYGGRFKLEVTAASPLPRPANDDCAAPTEVFANSSVQGTTVAADPDYGTGNFGSSLCSVWYEPLGADLVYRYRPTADGDVTVTVQPETDFDMAIWVTSGTCGAEGSCVAYQDDNYSGEAESVTFSGVAGTDYFIVVDSWSNEKGTFTLSVE